MTDIINIANKKDDTYISGLTATGEFNRVKLSDINFNTSGYVIDGIAPKYSQGGVSDGTPVYETDNIKMHYPAIDQYDGGVYNGFTYDVPNGHRELFISFDAKMPGNKHGLKFVKVFSPRDGSNYANTTFGLDYTGVDLGSMQYVAYGDGASISNDTQCGIFLDGSNPSYVGRAYQNGAVVNVKGQSFSSSDWGTGWHHFKIKIKFNSGTSPESEVNDGEYIVNIDGEDYVVATGLFNRHYSNSQFIERVVFGEWTQAPTGGSPAFDIHYRNIKFSQKAF